MWVLAVLFSLPIYADTQLIMLSLLPNFACLTSQCVIFAALQRPSNPITFDLSVPLLDTSFCELIGCEQWDGAGIHSKANHPRMCMLTPNISIP